MRWNNLYVAGVGTYLPAQVETVDEAIAAGRYTEEKKAMNGYRELRVAAPGETGPVMAVNAGRQAVERSGVNLLDFGLTVHASLSHQGLDLWTPASYVQAGTVGGSGPAFEVRQGCNGFMAGVDLAASYLASHQDFSAALVTAGDAFHLPYFDRWSSEEQNVNGDGAGALVLSNRSGFARIRSIYSHADPTLEQMSRGYAEWTTAPFHDGRTLQLSSGVEDFLRNPDVDLDDMIARIGGGVRHSLKQALYEAEIELADARFFLHQQLAETIVQHGICGLLGVDRSSTTYDWAKKYSMVGTADIALGLDHVLAERDPKPGDLVVLQSSGAGYVWTAAVLEILEVPSWV
ncbi:ketoacyl-ACP synthase III family protein [Lentzea sp. BCCO 10_0798]|uniref:Ketoacyl-ACP synthase III family protein n=1 Tax=Lentzea kristufekii TaxID=3095430 RepID=A0ABU4TPJ1_9PSEU|nr:ketoacyl-ACP synthase III family protein [Lentzea sp. BCCO 10_0798]MDX8050186.1 ketoacyl-ACP synthase III family protein [Lentzea sp. BCCO 10_0798]